ncbi:MAG: hypothetical protein ACK415_07550 [Thermodesulfovibrionales bacterium]
MPQETSGNRVVITGIGALTPKGIIKMSLLKVCLKVKTEKEAEVLCL